MNKRKVSCISRNVKTYKSLDLSTDCPKRREGNACKYCYVEAARKKGFNPKVVHDYIAYDGEILRMKPDTIAKLNDMGGLRVFSFGDYIHDLMYVDMLQICQDAKLVGLKLKAITKVTQFVDLFHDKFNIIHLSIDNVGCGVDWEVAKAYKAKYSNVLIRSAIMDTDDIPVLEPISDILTFNHSQNSYERFYIEDRIHYSRVFEGKVCCETNHCDTCSVKCGQSRIREV